MTKRDIQRREETPAAPDTGMGDARPLQAGEIRPADIPESSAPVRWFSDLKLKRKLTLLFSLILFIIMVFIYAYFPERQREAVYKEMNHRLLYLARAAAMGLGQAMAENEYGAIPEIGSWMREDPNFAYYCIRDSGNQVFDRYPEHMENKPRAPAEDFKPKQEGEYISVKVPIRYKETTWGSIVVGMDLANVKSAVRHINIASTVVLVLVFVIATFMIFFIGSIINKPIRSLMDSVNRVIRHGDYSERVMSTSRDEAGILASRFNEMIQMIESRDIELKRQFEELQQVTRLKDEFLAATTHDIRSPITAIMGFADLVMMNEELPDSDLKRIAHIRRAAEFLGNLVNDMLDIGSLESGKTELKLTPIRLAPVIESSVNTLRYMALPKEIELCFTDQSGCGDKINGDPDALLRVMNNLISNAIKFTSRGGRISVQLRTEREGEGARASISVTDNGIGIPEEKIPLLFDTYSKVSRNGTAGERGTGLGLSITRNLVQKHGGGISVSSRVGEGSCFTVTIPLLQQV